MSDTSLRFTHVGYGYIICANRVVAVFPPRAEPVKRMLRHAKMNGNYIDMTRGKETKSCMLLYDGTVVALAFNPMTIYRRLNEDPMDRAAKSMRDKYYDDEYIDDDNVRLDDGYGDEGPLEDESEDLEDSADDYDKEDEDGEDWEDE